MLHQPIGFAIVDREAAKRGAACATELTAEICKAYLRALRSVPAAQLPLSDGVSLCINIRHLGGYFSWQQNTVIRASDNRHVNA